MPRQIISNHTILNLLKAAAPERTNEIEELWNKYNPDVVLEQSRLGINMNATKDRIKFDPKTLDILWLLGYSGWQSIETYYPAIFCASLFFTSLEESIEQDENFGLFELEYKSRINSVQKIINSSDTDFEHWPPDIPEPTNTTRETLSSNEKKAAYDLVLLAVAFVFLHEFKHVIFASDRNAPKEGAEEEIACDVWARGFLTDKLDKYAKNAGHDYTEVLTKRSMAMALGAMILYEITPEQDRFGSKEYPPIVTRIESLISGTQLSDDSSFWIFAACLLVGVIRQQHIPIPNVPMSNRILVDELLSILR